MKITVTETMFHDAFRDCDRLSNFTYEARIALFEYFEELEECGENETELDPIGICCEFSQEHWEAIKDSYCMEAETMNEVIEALENDTFVVASFDDGSILYVVY